MAGEVCHRLVETNGISLHIAEQGPQNGPLVLLIHGFPELWFSWRHQMSALALHGFRAVAPDLRGYGDSEAPPSTTSYTFLHLVGDLIGLLDALQASQASTILLIFTWYQDSVVGSGSWLQVFVVGHDWGALLAWQLCMLRPDRVRGLVNLGVPLFPRGEMRPSDSFKVFGDGLYINQFQEPGRAEKSFARYDVSTVIKKFLSLEIPDLIAPLGTEIIDFLDSPSTLPPWLSEEEVQYFASKFQKTGFSGPLNYYRMMDMNWELLAPWHGAKVTTPTKFIVGDKDLGYKSFGTENYIKGETFRSLVPNLEVVVMDGHHFLQQERADQVTAEILSFFGSFT